MIKLNYAHIANMSVYLRTICHITKSFFFYFICVKSKILKDAKKVWINKFFYLDKYDSQADASYSTQVCDFSSS